MLVRHWMTTDLQTIAPSRSIQDTLDPMHRHNIRRLPVVNETNRLVGIIVRRECLTEMNAHPGKPVREVMVRNPATCNPNMPLGAVGMFMRNRRLGGLPVLNEKKELIGIITESDVLLALAQVTNWDQAAQHVVLRLPTWRDDGVLWLVDHGKDLHVDFIHILPHRAPNEEIHASLRLRVRYCHLP